jgi:glucuronoarabinoxylan endo-1,4-beta-xylanase
VGAVSFNAHAQCNVYMATNQQVIDGFGFSCAWCGTLTAAKNQSLYGTLGMSLLRAQIVNDVNGATDGAWSSEAQDVAAAHSYGAKAFATDWYGPGGWDDTNTYLLPQYYGANAVFLANAAKYYNLDWLSPANEPDLGWQMWTTNEFIEWTAEYGASIGVPLIEPESCWFADPYSSAIVCDPNSGPLISIAGGHGYGGPGTHPLELAAGKHLWMTEHYLGNGQDQVGGEAIPIAQEISQYMNDQFSAYVWWWVYDSDTTCNLVDDNGNIHKNGYAIGQFAKWIRPGSTRVSADYNPTSGVNVTAYNAYANGGVVIVAVNANNSSVSQPFTIHNGNATLLEGYQTSTNEGMSDIGSFTVTSGSFAATLPPQSITTFVQTNVISPNLPSLWTAQDIGSVGIVGSTTYTNSVVTNGVFTVTASGSDIWSTADAFRFVSQTNSSNFTILARVASVQDINVWSKAGVMVRDSLNPGAANAFIAVTPGNGVTYQYRSSDGGDSSSNMVTGVSAPCWVKLAGSGGMFSGYCSPDGTTWTLVGSTTLTSLTTAYAGLAVTAHNNTNLCTATFDNVSAPAWPTPPPSVPTGLTAMAGVEQVRLAWQPGSYATSYVVKRVPASGGTYSNIATVLGTRYADTDLPGGTRYYYEVTAVNAVGQSTNSAPASAMPSANVLSPWVAQDVGAVGLPGGESFTNGVFTEYASGADIWNAADAFRYIYVTTNSVNFTIIARVTSVEDIDSWSKAGVMVRDSLNPGAANAFIAVTPGNGVTFQYRSSDGGNSSNDDTPAPTAPYWVKLVRSGNTFTGYLSSNGTNWTQLGSVTFTMPSTVYVGLAVTAHDTANLCTATFDNVNAPGFTTTSASAPAGLVATGGVEQVALSWQPSSNAISYNVYRSTTSGGPYTLVTNVATTNYDDIWLIGNGTTYYYVVTAVNSLAGESDYSIQVGATTTVTLPSPWMTQDIGAPGVWGSAFFANGVFTVTGSGADIWNAADAFRFAYVTTNSSDFTLIARVASLQNINAWSKAGAMVRDSLNPAAANAFIAVTPGNGVAFQYRVNDGAGTSNIDLTGLAAPYWVKLVGSGGTYSGYCSPDGTTWTLAGSTTLTNFTTAYVGVAVTAHDNSSLCTATFDNVSGPDWTSSPLAASASAVSTNQISLTWNAVTNTSSYTVERSLTMDGPYAVVATGLTATSYLDSGLAFGTTYYYLVSATVSGNEITAAPASAATLSPYTYSWGVPVVFAGQNANQILTNFPGTKIAGAMFAQSGGNPITVAPGSGSPIVFTPANTSWASLAGGNGYTTGAWSSTTANANFNNCLNAFYYDGAAHTITLSGLVVGQEYSVQLFALDDRSLSPAGSARTVDWQNPTDSVHVSASYSMAANDYIVGTFTASNSVQAIQENMLNSGYGNFNCMVLRAVGWNPPPYFVQEPGNRTSSLGNSVSLSGVAAGDSTVSNPTITYQWAAGPAGGPYAALLEGAKYGGTTTTNLTINNVTTNDTAVDYVLIASNGGGATTSSPASLAAARPSFAVSAIAASTTQISLTWSAVTNAASYTVQRSLTNGGPYTVIASGLTSTSFLDGGLDFGTMYYYVVTATVSGNEITSASAAVATLSPSYGSLAHRYTFNESSGSTTAPDSIGGPAWNGTLPNGGVFASGQLSFSSASQQYLALPGGILSNDATATIEMWIPSISGTTTSPPYVYLFAIGNTDSGGNGYDYVCFAPNLARVAISAADPGYTGEQGGNLASSLGLAANLHLTCVFDCPAGVISVYTNGVLASAFTGITDPLSAAGDQFAYIGRSLNAGDPYPTWTIKELRFYSTALSGAEVAASDALGPNQLLSTNSPVISMAMTGTNLTLSWAVASAAYAVQARTNLLLGSWMNVTSPAPQILSNQWQVLLPPPTDAGAVFYRLVK